MAEAVTAGWGEAEVVTATGCGAAQPVNNIVITMHTPRNIALTVDGRESLDFMRETEAPQTRLEKISPFKNSSKERLKNVQTTA